MLIIGATTIFNSCTKDEPARTTGGLIIKVKLTGSTGYLTGVTVGLATSQANLDNSVYLKQIVTDSKGQADFGQLIAGNYYYDCYHSIGSTSWDGYGQVQIVAGQDLEATLPLESKKKK